MGDVIYISEMRKGGNRMQAQKSLTEEAILQLAKVVLFFANSSSMRLYKTKLNKLLFYTKFLYFKKFQGSLFAGDFICDHYGPVLDDLDLYLDILRKNNIIDTIFTDYGTIVVPKVKLNESVYSSKEMSVLRSVLNKFDSYTSREISDYSHRESLWCNTKIKETINLERAIELNEL